MCENSVWKCYIKSKWKRNQNGTHTLYTHTHLCKYARNAICCNSDMLAKLISFYCEFNRSKKGSIEFILLTFFYLYSLLCLWQFEHSSMTFIRIDSAIGRYHHLMTIDMVIGQTGIKRRKNGCVPIDCHSNDDNIRKRETYILYLCDGNWFVQIKFLTVCKPYFCRIFAFN